MTAAVIPIKNTRHCKNRLSGTATAAQRQRLSLDMLRDMLVCLGSCAELDALYVVTDDQGVKTLIAAEYPDVLLIEGTFSLNEAANAAAARLRGDGFDRMLFLHGDLPLITPEDIRQVAQLAAGGNTVLLADKKGTGTNGLSVPLEADLQPCFGPGSLARHMDQCRQKNLPVRLMMEGTTSLDIDLIEDLHMLAGQSRALRSVLTARGILTAQRSANNVLLP